MYSSHFFRGLLAPTYRGSKWTSLTSVTPPQEDRDELSTQERSTRGSYQPSASQQVPPRLPYSRLPSYLLSCMLVLSCAKRQTVGQQSQIEIWFVHDHVHNSVSHVNTLKTICTTHVLFEWTPRGCTELCYRARLFEWFTSPSRV